ncbi:MAG: NTP transferase domain-containing protein [Pseudomonadota bacterium]
MLVYTAWMNAIAMTGEHPQDVLQRLVKWQSTDLACALIVVIETEGGAVRAPGALLAVSEHDHHGYVSGGCIDADLILQARQAMADKSPRRLRYGAGSPFVDLPLPCGGAIELLIVPDPAPQEIVRLYENLIARQPAHLRLDLDGSILNARKRTQTKSKVLDFSYHPKLRIRIAGRGADALALAKLSDAAGYETRLQLLDEADIANAEQAGIAHITQLTTMSELPRLEDDAWTAFVLLFHDRDFEIPLLKQCLSGPAFYIGAVGSRRTHDIRCQHLRAAGCVEESISRIHGPVGLVPSLRDASSIALSTLAQIVEASKEISEPIPPRTAFVLLAAGAAKRFESGDKLTAELNGRPVLSHAAAILDDQAPHRAYAVVSEQNPERRSMLEAAGWTVLTNVEADAGQSTSLKCALARIREDGDVDQVVILLADMPYVPSSFVSDLLETALDPNVRAIMSDSDGVLSPPALFNRDLFDALETLTGDRGAKSIFHEMKDGAVALKLSPQQSMDIDCEADLLRAAEYEHA